MDKKNNRLTQAISNLKQAAGYILLFSLFINLFMLTVPLYMMQVFDRVLASHSTDTLMYLTVIALFIIMIFTALDIVRSKIAATAADWLAQHLTVHALSHSPDVILSGHAYGGQAVQDIVSLRQFICSQSIFSLFDIPWIPFYILLLYLLHPALGLISLIGAIVLLILAMVNHAATHKAGQQFTKQSAQVRKETAAILKNSTVIQAMGMMGPIIQRWFTKNQALKTLQTQSIYKTTTIMALSKGFRLALQILILAIGAYFVIYNKISPGTMIAASILMSRALAPVDGAIGTWQQFMTAKQAYHRLLLYFDHEQQQPHHELIDYPAPQGLLQCQGLIYMPPHSPLPTLKQISFELSAGKMLAIIGHTGSGKSTLAQLMVGSLAPKSGCVRLDGIDLYQWSRAQVGQHIGYLPQELHLFDGSIKENICRLAPANDEALIQAAKMADLYQTILKLPHGFDSQIGMDGIELSTGQKQKLALARALYGSPQLLVLDEPVANLDLEGELAIKKTLQQLKQANKTIIIITHHPSLMSEVDDLLVLNQGYVQHQGEKQQVFQQLKDCSTKEHSS